MAHWRYTSHLQCKVYMIFDGTESYNTVIITQFVTERNTSIDVVHCWIMFEKFLNLKCFWGLSLDIGYTLYPTYANTPSSTAQFWIKVRAYSSWYSVCVSAYFGHLPLQLHQPTPTVAGCYPTPDYSTYSSCCCPPFSFLYAALPVFDVLEIKDYICDGATQDWY